MPINLIHNYCVLVAAQKATFDINDIDNFSLALIKSCINYCLLQPDYRNYVVLKLFISLS